MSSKRSKPLLMRITTIPASMQVLLRGQLRFMRENGFDVVMVSSDGDEVAALKEQEGCEHYVIPLTRQITPLQDLKALWKLYRLMRRLKPDIVHTHTPKAGLIGMWAAMLAGVPVRLHTIAGLAWIETAGFKRRLLKFVEKLTFFPATRVFPNSFRQRDFLYDNHIGRNKMEVLGNGSSNGINTNHFFITPELKAAAQRLRVNEAVPERGWIWIFIGRIVKDKGMEELLSSFVQLHSEFPDDRLWLLGKEEPELDPLSAKATAVLKEHSAIRCWGFQTDVRPFLAASDILVFPSYREGFPNVPLQAGAMECALMLSDINGCNEIVQHGVNGLLVPPGDAVALQDAMLQLRRSPETMNNLRKNVREGIVKGYDQQQLWNILLNKYRSFL